MVPSAIASLVVYTVGAPVAFLAILLRHARAIQQDQGMRMLNQGGTEAANPNFSVRARYQELYVRRHDDACGMLCFAVIAFISKTHT